MALGLSFHLVLLMLNCSWGMRCKAFACNLAWNSETLFRCHSEAQTVPTSCTLVSHFLDSELRLHLRRHHAAKSNLIVCGFKICGLRASPRRWSREVMFFSQMKQGCGKPESGWYGKPSSDPRALQPLAAPCWIFETRAPLLPLGC